MEKEHRARLGALALAAALWPSLPARAASATASEGGPQALQAIVEEYEAERDRVVELMQASEGEASQEIYADAPWRRFVDAFRECAYESQGETSAQAWVWVVRTGKEFLPEDAREAVTNVMAAHMDSQAMDDLVNEIGTPSALGAEFVENALEQVRTECPSRNTCATAQFHLAHALMAGESSKDRRERARTLLTGLGTDYPTVTISDAQIERSLFELDNLLIGMRAPDFESVDADGVAFKLSDYRGKVVVVDFWGFW